MVEVRNTPVRLGVGWWGRAFYLHGLSPGRRGFCLRWRVERRPVDPSVCPDVDGRLMEIFRENVRWNGSSTRSDFYEFIGSLIISACDVVELEAVKLVFKASHLLIVGLHLGIMAAQALHDLVNYELRVTSNIEVSDP
jgi:hypothetical protein